MHLQQEGVSGHSQGIIQGLRVPRHCDGCPQMAIFRDTTTFRQASCFAWSTGAAHKTGTCALCSGLTLSKPSVSPKVAMLVHQKVTHLERVTPLYLLLGKRAAAEHPGTPMLFDVGYLTGVLSSSFLLFEVKDLTGVLSSGSLTALSTPLATTGSAGGCNGGLLASERHILLRLAFHEGGLRDSGWETGCSPESA